ncbi:MAG TPA: hypothetical protein VE871_04585 [Longimicrobium sp.]|nr:hypothetical protein [Longimicrobium sp.]
MKPHTVHRGGIVAATLLALAACDDATGTMTPAERAVALRTLVEVGQGSADRVLRAGHTVPVVARVTANWACPWGARACSGPGRRGAGRSRPSARPRT